MPPLEEPSHDRGKSRNPLLNTPSLFEDDNEPLVEIVSTMKHRLDAFMGEEFDENILTVRQVPTGTKKDGGMGELFCRLLLFASGIAIVFVASNQLFRERRRRQQQEMPKQIVVSTKDKEPSEPPPQLSDEGGKSNLRRMSEMPVSDSRTMIVKNVDCAANRLSHLSNPVSGDEATALAESEGDASCAVALSDGPVPVTKEEIAVFVEAHRLKHVLAAAGEDPKLAMFWALQRQESKQLVQALERQDSRRLHFDAYHKEMDRRSSERMHSETIAAIHTSSNWHEQRDRLVSRCEQTAWRVLLHGCILRAVLPMTRLLARAWLASGSSEAVWQMLASYCACSTADTTYSDCNNEHDTLFQYLPLPGADVVIGWIEAWLSTSGCYSLCIGRLACTLLAVTIGHKLLRVISTPNFVHGVLNMSALAWLHGRNSLSTTDRILLATLSFITCSMLLHTHNNFGSRHSAKSKMAEELMTRLRSTHLSFSRVHLAVISALIVLEVFR